MGELISLQVRNVPRGTFLFDFKGISLLARSIKKKKMGLTNKTKKEK